MYYYILFFIARFYYSTVGIFSSRTKQMKSETILDKISQYIEREKNTFIAKCEIMSRDVAAHDNYNTNVDTVFYSRKEFDQLIADAGNTIEKTWKTRILIEYTPHGNIIMFYNPYKLGFSYYSDINNISYPLLNVVAMKYVIQYHCLDIFFDNEVTVVDSPLIKIHFAQDTAAIKEEKTDEQNAKNKDFQKLLKSAPFIKYKKQLPSNSVADKTPVAEKKEYVRNKFIYLGKTVNFKFLQTTDNRTAGNPLNGFKSNIIDNLSGEVSLNKSIMNYREYKNSQKT